LKARTGGRKSLLPIKLERLLQSEPKGFQQFFPGAFLAIYPRHFFNPADPPIIFRFEYCGLF